MRTKRTERTKRTARTALPCALALALCAAPLAVPGLAPQAAAEPCRTQATGEDLPDGTGPYPLVDRLGLWQAWDLALGEGVTVAVVDSGVDATHPDLAGQVHNGSEFSGVMTEEEFERTAVEPVQDCEGHGTAIAGLVAAHRSDRMSGVAPGAAVYPVRMDDGVDRATPRTLAAAIDDAVGAGAGVINLSLARPVDDEPVRDAVARAVAADVVVVAAAGNEGNQGVSGGLMYPAAYDGVLAVGAVGDDGQPLDSSNAGPWVDLAGYGGEMAVVAPGGSGYRAEAGTSMAAAQVSGAAALVRSRFPDLTAAEVAQRLTDSATPVAGGRNDRTGTGIVDPFSALTHLGGGDGADGADGAGDNDEAAARPGHIPVQAVPHEEPLLSSTAATALAWSGVLLLAVVLGLLGAPAVRRAARRGWRAGPGPGPAGGERRAAAPPAAPGGHAWLDGTERPARGAAHPTRNRTR
ncbi:S8 family serine peptidase [Streptomyces sp. MP131-18]|uniref:S8 family serine peptidase n=1 Tax=Streptomyces sp. MP131-18 TaxID=1857892 RepID=UPI00097BD1FB|nr:S8 family serine peptidase [Streptomyces sp. MP131-18]ONK12462.1 Subtilisin [Streptomyces sp. MP131-18]